MQAISQPSWTRKSLLEKIPCRYKRCNNTLSFLFLFGDIFALLLINYCYAVNTPHNAIAYVLFTVIYMMTSGLFMTDLWVIGHECGHGAFCKPRWLESCIGILLHSSLLTPFFAWRESHRRHHRYNKNSALDMAWVKGEHNKKKYGQIKGMLNNPLGYIFISSIDFFIYIFGIGTKIGSRYQSRPFYRSNHFSTKNPIYKGMENLIRLDRSAFIFSLSLSLLCCVKYGFITVFIHYYGLIFIVHFWIVTFTYMHHANEGEIWFDDDEWTFEKGLVCT